MYYILSYLFQNNNPNTIFTVFFSSFDNNTNKVNIQDEIIFELENKIIKTNVQNIEFVAEDEYQKYVYKIEFTIPCDFLKNKNGRFSISILGKNQKIQLLASPDSIFNGTTWDIFKFEEPSDKISNNGRWEIIDNSIYRIAISNDSVKENYITIIGSGFEKDCKINLINNATRQIINPQWCFCSATKIIFSISKNTVQFLEPGLYDIIIENPSIETNKIKDTYFKIMIVPEIEISNSLSNDKIILLGEEQYLYISGEHFSDGKTNGYINVQFDFFLNGVSEKQHYVLTNDINGKINGKKSDVFAENILYDPELICINENLLCIHIKKNISSRKGISDEKLNIENLRNASIFDIINSINVQEISMNVILYDTINVIYSFPYPLYAIFNIKNITNVNNTPIFDINSPKMIIEPSISNYEEPFVREHDIDMIGFYGNNSANVKKYYYKNHEYNSAFVYLDVVFRIKNDDEIRTFVIPHNCTDYNTYSQDMEKIIRYQNGEIPSYNSIFIDYVLSGKNIEYYPRTTDTSKYGFNNGITKVDNIKSDFTYKGQINEFIKSMKNKDTDEISIDVAIEFNFASVYFSSGNAKKQNIISNIKNDAKFLSNFIPVVFSNKVQKTNFENFQDAIMNIANEAAFDFAANDYYLSKDMNCFFQKSNNESRKAILKVILFAYYAFVCASDEQINTNTLIKEFYNAMSAILNEDIDSIDIKGVSLKKNYVLTTKDIASIMDNKCDFIPPFCDNDKPKNYITQELQSNVVKSMVMILRNCENMEDLNDMLKKTNPKFGYSQNMDNFTLPAASIHSMCKYITDAIIYYNFESEYKQIAKVILPDELLVSGANATFAFAQQIPHEKEYYMLIPYPDIVDSEEEPSILSYMDYGAPILDYMNGLLKLQNNKCVINSNEDETLYLKSQLEPIINDWINKTLFLLISDNGKYNGSNIYSAPSELYMHYLQTIHSSLIGNPFANIISNIDSIKKCIEEGNQENNNTNKLGKQLVENILNNCETIGNAVLKSDPSRTSNPDNVLFKKGDMLTIFVSISGSIGITPVAINNIFYKCIDPNVNNTSSFKQHIINNSGDRIKPLIYAIMVPINENN
jgi:hypothetical protein